MLVDVLVLGFVYLFLLFSELSSVQVISNVQNLTKIIHNFHMPCIKMLPLLTFDHICSAGLYISIPLSGFYLLSMIILDFVGNAFTTSLQFLNPVPVRGGAAPHTVPSNSLIPSGCA